MKILRFLPLSAVALAMFLGGPLPGGGTLHAQDETENNATSSTTYDSTGKVTAINPPSTITVTSRRGPFTYRIDPDIHVFRADNKAVGIRDVQVGQTVTVFYYKYVGQETASRVVIHKPKPASK